MAAATLMFSCGGKNVREGSVELKNFPTRQQTTDYSCGCVAALMVMDFYGHCDETEESLAKAMHTHVDSSNPDALPGSATQINDFGTSVGEMFDYFIARSDFNIEESSFEADCYIPGVLTDTAVCGIQAVGNVPGKFKDYGEAAMFFSSQLQQGHPVLVCWNAWGGHWTVCIGYDDNGTPNFYDDDILTMADPYDSTDGKRDGITKVNLVHFFYDWFSVMTPKPWQLQPFLVVSSC